MNRLAALSFCSVGCVLLICSVFSSVLEDYASSTGVVIEEVGDVVYLAFDDDPAGFARATKSKRRKRYKLMLGYFFAV